MVIEIVLIYLKPVSQLIYSSQYIIDAQIDAMRPDAAVLGHFQVIIDRQVQPDIRF